MNGANRQRLARSPNESNLPSGDRPRSFWALLTRMNVYPVSACVLVGLNGLYLLLVAFNNITDFTTNQVFVKHVLEMDTTNFGAAAGTQLDPAVMWRSITNPVVQNVAYVLLISWETVAAIILLTATLLWLGKTKKSRRVARNLSSVGLLMLIALFTGGFIVIGGEWFEMWTSTSWNGLEPAFRNSMFAVATLIFLHVDWIGAAPFQIEPIADAPGP